MPWHLLALWILAAGPDRPPSLLMQLEEATEAAYEDADSGAWEKVQKDTATFRDVWSRYRAASHHLNADWASSVGQAQSTLDEAVASKDALAARTAANRISHLLAPWIDDVMKWPGVAELDPLEREVALAADQAAWGRARQAASGARRILLGLPCGNKKLKAGVKKALAAQEEAVAAKALKDTKSAERALEEWVDKFERACGGSARGSSGAVPHASESVPDSGVPTP
jgi:hypothetical protein